jgi:hypothetical protein
VPSELQRVAGELVACLDMMPRVIGALHVRARRCREVAGYVGGLSSGSPALQAAAYHLDAAATECEKAAHFAERAYRDAKGWAAAMVGSEGGAAPSGQRGAPRPSEPGPSTPRPPEDGGDPDAQKIIRRLPVRENDTGKTRGVWAPPDKEEMPLVSGYGHYQRLADDHAKRLGLKPMRSTSHVEVKFALFMRERGLSDETIYINNRPCRGDASCPRWIESFLPRGAKLTVHWPGGGPWTFTGKGES